jgi:phosphopantothenoylcysteine decarboxylase/phosphopantothenate--cysteine ligase
MLQAVIAHAPRADVLLMAAAVADFRPENSSHEKIKRANGVPNIKLIANPDILLELSKLNSKKPYLIVGFAAESQGLLANAQKKLKAKDLDLIVANDISATDAGFEVDTNRILLLDRSGLREQLPLMSKEDAADAVLLKVIDLLKQKGLA